MSVLGHTFLGLTDTAISLAVGSIWFAVIFGVVAELGFGSIIESTMEAVANPTFLPFAITGGLIWAVFMAVHNIDAGEPVINNEEGVEEEDTGDANPAMKVFIVSLYRTTVVGIGALAAVSFATFSPILAVVAAIAYPILDVVFIEKVYWASPGLGFTLVASLPGIYVIGVTTAILRGAIGFAVSEIGLDPDELVSDVLDSDEPLFNGARRNV